MKILISDLDGTIYRNKNVSSTDLKELNDFVNHDMLIIATGRNENTFSFLPINMICLIHMSFYVMEL